MGVCAGKNRVPVKVSKLDRMEASRKATDLGMHHELRRIHSARLFETKTWTHETSSLSPKQAAKRNRILQELLASETSYIRSLYQIFDEYLDPLFERGFIDDKFYLLFGIVDCLINFHEIFLLSIGDPENDLFEVMDRFCDDMTLYNQFVRQYDDIISSVVELRSRKKEADAFFCYQSKQSSILPLDSLLLMPIQRVPRYQLLFKDLVKSTPEDFWDYDLLSNVLSKFKTIASEIDRCRGQVEREASLVSLQNKVKECPFPIFCTKRRFISENAIIEQGHERWLETCCDRMIVCDRDYTYRRHINLNKISEFKRHPDANKLTILIDDSKYDFTFIDECHSELCLSVHLLLNEIDKSKVMRDKEVQMVERHMREAQSRSSASWKQLLNVRFQHITKMNQESEYFGHSCVSKPNDLLQLPEPRRLQMSKSVSQREEHRSSDSTGSKNSLPDACFFNHDGTELSDSGEWAELRPELPQKPGWDKLPGPVVAHRMRKQRCRSRSLIQLHRKNLNVNKGSIFEAQDIFPLSPRHTIMSPKKLSKQTLRTLHEKMDIAPQEQYAWPKMVSRDLVISKAIIDSSDFEDFEPEIVISSSEEVNRSVTPRESLRKGIHMDDSKSEAADYVPTQIESPPATAENDFASAIVISTPLEASEGISPRERCPEAVHKDENKSESDTIRLSSQSEPPRSTLKPTTCKRSHSRDSIRKDPSFAMESVGLVLDLSEEDAPRGSQERTHPTENKSSNAIAGKREPSTRKFTPGLMKRPTQIGDVMEMKRDPSSRKYRSAPGGMKDLSDQELIQPEMLASSKNIHKSSSFPFKAKEAGYAVFSRGRRRMEKLGSTGALAIRRSQSAQQIRNMKRKPRKFVSSSANRLDDDNFDLPNIKSPSSVKSDGEIVRT